MSCLDLQTVSYIAEHVVGTGSFGVVFQVSRTSLVFLLNLLSKPFAVILQ